jgi:hypothetical protein
MKRWHENNVVIGICLAIVLLVVVGVLVLCH